MRLLRARRVAEVESAHLTTMAVRIQRVWRGHHSRTRYADFHRRRLFLTTVHHTGARLAQSMAASSALLHSLAASAAAQAHHSQVRSLLGHTHHLLSTAAIPGVLSSPWGAAYEAKVDGVGVESVIREVWRERQVELRRLREDVRRERRKLRERREVVEMRLDMGDDAPAVEQEEREEEEAKVQLMLEEEEEETAVEMQTDDGSKEVMKGEERAHEYVRFPPIHSRPTSAEDAAWKADREREALSLNRSIILTRDGRTVTVERPKQHSVRR